MSMMNGSATARTTRYIARSTPSILSRPNPRRFMSSTLGGPAYRRIGMIPDKARKHGRARSGGSPPGRAPTIGAMVITHVRFRAAALGAALGFLGLALAIRAVV